MAPLSLSLGMDLGGPALSAPGGPFTLASFGYGVDFVAGTARGGTQPYGNNTNDGRLFRDPTNVVGCLLVDGSGVFQTLGSSGIRRTTKGFYNYPTATVRNLQANDITNAAWVATNITVAKDQPDLQGNANSFSSLTCAVANGTILQSIVLASANQLYQVKVKRLVGTGTIWMTIDGGTTWVDVTAQISGAYATAFISQASVTNPVIGFKMLTVADKIAVGLNMMFTPPVATMNVPREDLVATVAATILNSQSRPSADIADLAPNTMITIARGYFAFYHECTSIRPTGGFLFTGATGINSSVDATSVGAVKFNANAANAITPAGKWFSDGVTLNKTAGVFRSDGTVDVACNASICAVTATGGTPEVALDHFDLSTNGAGSNSLYSWTKKFYMHPNANISRTDLLALVS